MMLEGADHWEHPQAQCRPPLWRYLLGCFHLLQELELHVLPQAVVARPTPLFIRVINGGLTISPE